jgi:hypothetical protein
MVMWLSTEAAIYWLFIVIISFLCLLFDWSFKALKRLHFPEAFHLVQGLKFAHDAKLPTPVMVEHSGTPLTPSQYVDDEKCE